MPSVTIVPCWSCKGRGYHEHRCGGHNPDPDYRQHLCAICGGDSVLEEVTEVTHRRFRASKLIEALKEQANG